jgi:hypothetical protein
MLLGNNEADGEIKARIIAGHACYHARGHLLKKRCITQLLDECLYKKNYITDVTYCAES